MDTFIHERRCTRCRHRWLPRKTSKPVTCPNCSSAYWDRPKGLVKVRTVVDIETAHTATNEPDALQEHQQDEQADQQSDEHEYWRG